MAERPWWHPTQTVGQSKWLGIVFLAIALSWWVLGHDERGFWSLIPKVVFTLVGLYLLTAWWARRSREPAEPSSR